MATRKFIPKKAGMTANDIARFLNEECEMWEVELGIKAKDLTDPQCQKFVDVIEDCREEAVDMREEDAVDWRSGEILKFIKTSLKRKDIAEAIVAERGY